MFVVALHSRQVWPTDLSKAFAPPFPCGSTANVFQIKVCSLPGTLPDQPFASASSSNFVHSLSAREEQLSLNLIILLGK